MKKDKSKQGYLDNDIRSLIDLLNSKGYETTSSCSGRIVLLRIPKFGEKQYAEWLYKTHGKANAEEILEILKKEKQKVYFLQEPPVIHVNCMDLDSAARLLSFAVQAGFKRSGIISIKKCTLEIKSSERLETPLLANNEDFVKMLVEEANEKLERAKSKIRKLEKTISSL